jgi:2Fe-2S type ferredoxin
MGPSQTARMVELLGLGLGVGLAVVAAVLHAAKGTQASTPEDIAQEVLERRAATVEETDFPEPMNRSIGGGGGAVAVGAGAEAEGELEEGGEEDAGFDPASIPEDEIEEFDVDFEKEGDAIPVANNETILDAGEDEGWDLPFACREGQCLSCAGRITDGDASEYMQMSNNEVLSEEEIEKGYCLTCVAYPTDDFSIETSEAP